MTPNAVAVFDSGSFGAVPPQPGPSSTVGARCPRLRPAAGKKSRWILVPSNERTTASVRAAAAEAAGAAVEAAGAAVEAAGAAVEAAGAAVEAAGAAVEAAGAAAMTKAARNATLHSLRGMAREDTAGHRLWWICGPPRGHP